MSTRSFSWLFSRTGTVCATMLLVCFSVQEVVGQAPRRGQAAPPRGGSPQQEAQQSEQSPPQEPFIHGIRIGGGLTAYQGDLSRNPNHNILKYIGRSKLNIQAGVDHRMGLYEQYGVGADLSYSRVGGETTGNLSFSNNLLALDFYGDYELPYVREGLFRVFLGGGPVLLINPTYANFPESDSRFRPDLGTRVVGSLKAGVTIIDRIQIGTRMTSTDFVDGHSGISGEKNPDFVGFVKFTHRFDLTN